MIRPLQASDRDVWLPLWRGYLAFYESDLPQSDQDATFTRLVDPAGDIFGFGWFDDDGTLLGIVHYFFHQHTWTDSQRCYLNDVFTLPEARGRGVARGLIEAVYEAAGEQGADQVYWTTQEFNSTARALYDKVAVKTPFIKYAKVLPR